MATIAIGDVHGNRRALDDLLAKVAEDLGSHDTVVFLGDYIDRGPDAKGCVERILEFRATVPASVVTLLGNHEDWLLQTLADPTRHSWLLNMEAFDTIASYSQVAATALRAAMEEAGLRMLTERIPLPYELFFSSVPQSHLDFFRDLPTHVRTPEAVCVHAGLDSSTPDLERQSRAILVWGTDEPPRAHPGPEIVVYGHWGDAIVASNGWPAPRFGPHSVGIDTIAHGVLTAIRLPEATVLQSSYFESGW
jgi:serine/threonine protein phosphatase 1